MKLRAQKESCKKYFVSFLLEEKEKNRLFIAA